MGYTRRMRTLFLALLIFIFPVLAWSHPGKTDSVGGHKCYKGCEKWELLFGEYHLHDKDGKPIRVAKKVKKKTDVSLKTPPVDTGAGREGRNTAADAGGCHTSSGTQAVQPEKSLSPSPLILLLLALLLLLLLIKRRERRAALKTIMPRRGIMQQ